jgi:hypothetical protein
MPIHGEVYSIQHYVIKFVSYLQQVIDFLRGLRAPPPIKLTAPNITEILLKVALNTINLNQTKPVQIITKVVSSNPAHSEVYSIQLYVIKFVSDMRQVGGFLWVLRFSPAINLTATI